MVTIHLEQSETMPDNQIDYSKDNLSCRDEPLTEPTYLPPGHGVRERQLSLFPFSQLSTLVLAPRKRLKNPDSPSRRTQDLQSSRLRKEPSPNLWIIVSPFPSPHMPLARKGCQLSVGVPTLFQQINHHLGFHDRH
jgi:hypothetical protein